MGFTYKELTTDFGHHRTQWCIIDSLAAIESMKQLRIYTYGGLWIWPGWDYEGHPRESNLVWYPLQSHFDGQTAAMYIWTPTRKKGHDEEDARVGMWLTRADDPLADDALYHFVL